MGDSTPLQIITERVVGGGYCVGCGACAAVENSPLQMRLNEVGQFCARLPDGASGEEADDVAYVCPFSGVGPNEDDIARPLFADTAMHDSRIGYYRKTYAGYVAEGDFRSRGSSGGMGSWISAELIRSGLVDAVVHVGPVPRNGPQGVLFEFSISRSVDELRAKAKSQYYPVEISQVIKQLRKSPGRYAVIGVPCFIKAIRLLSLKEPLIASRVRFTIGLVCGHLKSQHFASMFAWQCGVHPDNLEAIDFRYKIPGASANRYGVQIQGRDDRGQPIVAAKSTREVYGANWGHGFFKPQACDYCDDIMAETADLTIGDAWLPQYVQDGQGTNIIVIRNAELEPLITQARADGRLKLDDLSVDDIARSQDANYRHRRDGLRYRLHLKQSQDEWAPPKRVRPAAFLLQHRFRRIQRARIELAALSHRAFQAALRGGQFHIFVDMMDPLVSRYDRLYSKSTFSRGVQRLKRILHNLLRSR